MEGKRNDVGMRFVLDPNAGDGGFLKPKHEKVRTDTIGLDIAAHRKSLHGKLAHTIAQMGTTINREKTSFKGWQKQYGRSIGLRAPGMFVAHLARIVAKTGGTLVEVSAFKTKLSQYCHHCGRYIKKARSQRWHHCTCGCGPVQRDLYSAFLLAHLEPEQTIPSVTQRVWESAGDAGSRACKP